MELQGVPALGEQVSGGLIRDNLINLKNGEPYFAILLLNTQRTADPGQRDPGPELRRRSRRFVVQTASSWTQSGMS